MNHNSSLTDNMMIGYIHGIIDSTLDSSDLKDQVIWNDYDKDVFKDKMSETALSLIKLNNYAE